MKEKFFEGKRLRFFLYTLLIFLTGIFYHLGFFPKIFGISPMPLIPLTVAVAMNDRSIPGMIFGLLAGALWDLGSVSFDGFFMMALTICGFFSGALTSFLLRKNLFSCLSLSLLVSLFTSAVYCFVFMFMKGFEGAFSVFKSYYLPSVLYTLIFAVIYYYLVGYIFEHTKSKKEKF